MARSAAKKKNQKNQRKNKNKAVSFGHVPKRLQTKLQATIAFACYDSDEVLKAGKSAIRGTVSEILSKLYLPPINKKDERVCYVDLFL